MAKPIVVNFSGGESSFDLAKLDRAKIYGAKRRIFVDAGGQPCTRAALTSDGLYLLQSGMTAQGYFDETGRWVQKSEMAGLDSEGNALPLMLSTLGVAQEASEVSPAELLGYSIETTYALQAQTVSPKLVALLESGAIVKFPFNYGADYHLETAFLLKNAEGYFCLVGNPVATVWCEPKAVAVISDDDTAAVDDLDFDMF